MNVRSLGTADRDSPIVGRDIELSAVELLVSQAGDGPAALVLEGRPGMGKSVLFDHALGRARETDLDVLLARPAESEVDFAYAGLVDLLGGMSDEEIEALPPVLARGLRVALLREAEDEATPQRHVVARAVLGLLRRHGGDRPTLLAIDDAQWLDPPTARVMEFVARRITHTDVRVLLTRRTGEGDAIVDALQRTLPEERLSRLIVGPLGLDDLHAMVVGRLGIRLRRPALSELHRLSEGNPLHALELARAGSSPSDAPRELGSHANDLDGLLRVRLAALSDPARRVVVAAAASVHPSARALATIASPRAIDEALQAGILRRDADRLRFVHPLFASAAYGHASDEERRGVHGALVELAADEDEAALHMARAAAGASGELAAQIERAAAHAAARGAPDVAARLAEHAARLTPDDQPDDRVRRLAQSADHCLSAGDPVRGRQILEGLVAEQPPGPARADLLWRLADAVGDDLGLSIRLCEQALAEAGEDDEMKASIHLGLATFSWLAGDLQAATDHSRLAAGLAEAAGDVRLAAYALADVAHGEVVLGLPVDWAGVDRALQIEAEVGEFPPLGRPSFQLGVVYLYTDRLDEARPLIEAELKRVEASGDESARVAVLFRLAELELRAGNWRRALVCASESRTLALQAGIEQEQSVALNGLAMVCAHVGRTTEAIAAATDALAIAETSGDRMSVLRARGALGLVALSLGDPAAAHGWLEPALAETRRLGIGELSISGVVENELEALVALDELGAADSVVALLEEKALPDGRTWHLAVAARGRAMIAAARGDGEAARSWAERAVEAHERVPQPFQLARTLLAKGLIERRQKRRGDARASLTRALEMFDSLGAPLWAEKAGAELARLSGRPPSDGSLTVTEQRVVELVVAGHTNAEAAARLFVTVRTIEAHLSRIYAKLGVRSRAELAATFRSRTAS